MVSDFVLYSGSLAEEGTHDALMRAGGLYARMWEEQQKVRPWVF